MQTLNEECFVGSRSCCSRDLQLRRDAQLGHQRLEDGQNVGQHQARARLNQAPKQMSALCTTPPILSPS